MLEKPFPPPSEVVSTDLPPTPEISSGLGIMRELSHITKPVIRHIMFSTHSLPHFTVCLHSNPGQQDWIQLAALSIINKVTSFIIPMLQDTGFPSWGNIMTTSSTNAGLASIYI